MADLPEPISRQEQYLQYIALNMGSGGGGGGGGVTFPIEISQGGTSATTAEGARTNLDIYSKGEVDTKLNEKANTGDVYTKSQVDTSLNSKANVADVYIKSDIDTKLLDKANVSDVYTKLEADGKLDLKANASDVYNKTETDSKLDLKANSDNVYDKTYIDGKINSTKVEIGSSATAGFSGISIGNSTSGSSSSISIGNGASCGSSYGIAIGKGANVNSSYETSIGFEAKSTGGVAIGYKSESSDTNTVSVGNSTTKRRIVNVANPTDSNDVANKAYVDSKVSANRVNVVQGTGSSSTDVMSQKAVTDELNNKVSSTSSKIIIGLSASAEVDQSHVLIGNTATSGDTGYRNVAIGSGSTTNNTASIAIGTDSSSTGSSSVAIGWNANASSDYGISILSKEVTGSYAISIGNQSIATADSSVAIGKSSKATEENTVSVGDTYTKRRIVNVDTPVNDNDVAIKSYVDKLKPTVLFHNNSGEMGTITLSDNISKYMFVDIISWDFTYFRCYDLGSHAIGICKFSGYGDQYEGKYFVEQFTEKIAISGNTLTRHGHTSCTVFDDGTSEVKTDQNVPIRTIIGYKD